MKLTILGQYGPYPKEGGATSGYLLRAEDKTFVLDFGTGVLSKLLRYEKPENVSAIVISHLHFDHVADLGVLCYYFQLSSSGKKVDLLLPEKNSYTESIEKTNAFNVLYYNDSSSFSYGGVDISFLKSVHPVTTYSALFSCNNKKFLYTGDGNFSSELERGFSLADVALCDAGFLQCDWTEKKQHASVKGLCTLGQKYGVKVILSHLSPKYTKEEVQKEAFGDYLLAEADNSVLI